MHWSCSRNLKGTAPPSAMPLDAHFFPAALQFSFPFNGKQHEVHSLCSMAEAGLVGMALAGKRWQSGPDKTLS